jgi:hypothetical protein
VVQPVSGHWCAASKSCAANECAAVSNCNAYTECGELALNEIDVRKKILDSYNFYLNLLYLLLVLLTILLLPPGHLGVL